jgi:hypothetical protein
MTFFELVEILHVHTHELIGFFIQHPNPQKSPPSADPIHNTFFALSAFFVIQFYNKKKIPTPPLLNRVLLVYYYFPIGMADGNTQLPH